MSKHQPTNQERFWWEKYKKKRNFYVPRRPVDLERIEKQKELHRRRVEKFSKID